MQINIKVDEVIKKYKSKSVEQQNKCGIQTARENLNQVKMYS